MRCKLAVHTRLFTRIVNMHGGVEHIVEGLIISFEGFATKAAESDITLTLAEISCFAQIGVLSRVR